MYRELVSGTSQHLRERKVVAQNVCSSNSEPRSRKCACRYSEFASNASRGVRGVWEAYPYAGEAAPVVPPPPRLRPCLPDRVRRSRTY